jgi:glucan phosphoethanolaminetransferase (alkaline phosphatase superfamily)
MQVLMLKWLTVAFSLSVLSGFVSMMAASVGSQGADFRDLLILQTALLPIAVGITLCLLAVLIRRRGFKGALRTLRARLPGWLIFAVLAANSLVLVTELSLVLIYIHAGEARPWQQHVPAATVFSSSLAVAACYVSFRITDGAGRGPAASA